MLYLLCKDNLNLTTRRYGYCLSTQTVRFNTSRKKMCSGRERLPSICQTAIIEELNILKAIPLFSLIRIEIFILCYLCVLSSILFESPCSEMLQTIKPFLSFFFVLIPFFVCIVFECSMCVYYQRLGRIFSTI